MSFLFHYYCIYNCKERDKNIIVTKTGLSNFQNIIQLKTSYFYINSTLFRKLFWSTARKKCWEILLQIWGWRPRNGKMFEITKIVFETEYFFNLLLEASTDQTYAVSICAWFLKCQFGSLLQTRKKIDSESNLIFFRVRTWFLLPV